MIIKIKNVLHLKTLCCAFLFKLWLPGMRKYSININKNQTVNTISSSFKYSNLKPLLKTKTSDRMQYLSMLHLHHKYINFYWSLYQEDQYPHQYTHICSDSL